MLDLKNSNITHLNVFNEKHKNNNKKKNYGEILSTDNLVYPPS